MKVLLSSVGSRGDMQPMLALALGLRQRGHEPVVAAPPSFRDWIEQLGLPFHSLGFDIYAWSQNETDLARNPLHAVRRMTGKLQEEVASQFRDLRPVAQEADCIVNTGLSMAASSLAEKHRLPYFFAAFVPGLIPSDAYAPPILPLPSMPRIVNRAAWEGMEILYRNSVGSRIDRERVALGLPRVGRFSELFMGTDVLVATDPELSDAPQNVQVPFVQTGFWAYASEDSLPEPLDAFLSSGSAPWYLGFGSVPDHAPAETTRMFVEVIQRLRLRAIVSRGWANLARDPLPSNFFVTTDVPHEKLFPRTAGIIHHGGSGTTHTGARAGVPQIVVPHGADQFFWAKQVEKLGLGPAGIAKTRLTADRLFEALRWIQNHPECTVRAGTLGAQLRRTNGVDHAIDHIEQRLGMRQAATA